MKKYLVDFKEGFLISLRAIRANKMRAILTTLGIIIGIVAVTTMSTAIVGLRQAFLESISSIGSDVLYVDKFEWFGGKDWRFYRNRKNITWEQYEFLRDNLSEYDAMAPVARTFGRTIEYEERNTQTTVVYGTIDEYIKISSAVPDEGRFINDMDLRSNKRVIVIGSDIKEAL
ncbi:MAG: peptide ABC transporter permease, partial [Ignavibacteria bacterium]